MLVQTLSDGLRSGLFRDECDFDTFLGHSHLIGLALPPGRVVAPWALGWPSDLIS